MVGMIGRGILFAILWWALTEGMVGGWVESGFVVIAALLSSYLVMRPGSWRWRFRGFLRFGPYFLRQSIRGGTDVALRAFHPRMPIRPGKIDYTLRLPDGPARMFLINAVSLIPGTVSAQLHANVLKVHLLDREMHAHERIAELESRVAALFGMDL